MLKDAYQPIDAIATAVQAGRRRRGQRIRAADMLSLDEAAALMSVDESTFSGWIRSGQCIGPAADRTTKLPRWQFDPSVWPAIPRIADSLRTMDGWQILSFLETANPALHGLTPRAALEQGVPISRVVGVAAAEAH